MTVKVGDDVYVLNSAGSPTYMFAEGVHKATAANLTVLQGLVNGAVARVLNAGVKRFLVTLVQASTAAPVVTVLENGLSALPASAYVSAGNFTLTLASEFTVGKTFVIQTDIQAVADISLSLNAISISTDGNGKLDGHTLYVEVRQ